MGIYTNLVTGGQTISPSKPRVGLDRSSAEQLLNEAAKYDPTIATAYAAKDEVQTIPIQTSASTGNTYTLTVSLPRLVVGTFTTGALNYDDSVATVETAIDIAATAAAVTGWTNGDISVGAGGGVAGVSDGAVTLTFDGTSVAGQPADLTVLTPTGWTQDGTIAKTTAGQTDREATQAMFWLGVVEGTLQNSGDAPTDWTRPEALVKRPRYNLIKDLAHQAAWEDGSDDVITAVNALYSLQ